MCGRYTLSKDKEKIISRFGLSLTLDYLPRYNVSPGQMMPVIPGNFSEKFPLFIWGLIPNYSPDTKTSQHYFNIKTENLLNRSLFKDTLRTQRCLIPADGFYDWKKDGKVNVPYRITLLDDELFAIAGLWDRWENVKNGTFVHSFSILTKPASGACREISERMPVVLPHREEKRWVEGKLNDLELQEIINNSESENLSYYKCHKIVNSPENDIPQCVEAAPRLYPGDTYNLFDV